MKLSEIGQVVVETPCFVAFLVNKISCFPPGWAVVSEESKERSNSVMDGNRDTSSVHSYVPLRNEIQLMDFKKVERIAAQSKSSL